MRCELFVAVVMILAMPIAVLASDASTSDREETLEAQIKDLDRRLAVLEAVLNPSPTASAPQPIPAPSAESMVKPVMAAPLELLGWDFKPRSGENGSTYYTITVTLKNSSLKAIKLVDAGITFSDLLDAHIFGIRLSPDVKILPGKTHIDKGDYRVNRFSNEQGRMKDMNKADIKVSLDLRKIVFTDNSVWSQK